MPESAPVRPRGLLGVAGAVLVGALTALQARVNGQLGVRIDDGLVAAFISFGSGFAILVVLAAALPAGRAGAGRLWRGVRGNRIPWWLLLGGVAGAFTVATQGLTVGIIGVALFTVGLVAGQTVTGVVLDRSGYGPAGVTAVTMPRVLGAALAVAAVAFSLAGDVLSRVPVWMLILPFLVGAGIAWQQATNGRLQVHVGSPLTATLVNFTGGALVLAVAAAASVIASGPAGPLPGEPWLYTGGAIGVVYIFLSAALAPRIGVLLLGLGSVLGLLAASILLDAIWPPAAPPAMRQSILTVVIALAGVVIAAQPWRRSRG